MGRYTAPVEEHLVLPARVRLPPDHEGLLRHLQRPVPTPVAIRLLIDTGSKRTTFIPGVVRHLQPTPSGEGQVITPLGSVRAERFWVSLEFPEAGLATFAEVLVARLPMPAALGQF